MGAFDSFKKFIGIEEDEDDELTQEEIQAAKDKLARESRTEAPGNRKPPSDYASTATGKPDINRPSSAPVIERRPSVNGTNAFKLVLIEPKSFDECPKLVDGLKGRRPIIINLEKIETETAKKIFDFLSGATYALNGSVQKIANNIFIFAPESVDITASEERNAFDFGQNKSPWR